jgi:hypothetical protein
VVWFSRACNIETVRQEIISKYMAILIFIAELLF